MGTHAVRPPMKLIDYIIFVSIGIGAGLVVLLLTRTPAPVAGPAPTRVTPVTRCIDTGGMPVTSIWDGRLTNCIFPPERSK